MTVQEVGIIGLLAGAAAMWQQVVSLLTWPIRWFVIRADTGDRVSHALFQYLMANARRIRLSRGHYSCERVNIRPLGRVGFVFGELLDHTPQLFILRGRPFWYIRKHDGSGPYTMAFFYLRWSIDWDSLLGEVAEWLDSTTNASDARYRIISHPYESDGNVVSDRSKAIQAPTSSADDSMANAYGCRLLHWQKDQIGWAPPLQFERMSLRPEIDALATDVRRFVASRDWCEERSIPWRRGWLLSGPPGTGKTSFVRGIGVEHDLPVHVFDIGAMNNSILRCEWSVMLRDTPCIALIEDIDRVYDGSELIEDIGPTFDALLNCIGGINTADGVLVFVTTNRQERVDPALRRGGRLDQEVEFLPLDSAGKEKMVRRIFVGDDEAIQRALQDKSLDDMPPASLQEWCCKQALARRFGDS